MMELVKLRLVSTKVIFVLSLVQFFSCSSSRQSEGELECILGSIENKKDDIYIVIGQHNGWSDTSALIMITYYETSMNLPNSSSLKGKYSGNDVYFYQTNINPMDTKEYNQVPNNIVWKKNVSKINDDEKEIPPPYDPMSIHIEYNTQRGCISAIVNGKGFMVNDFESKCNYCQN